MSVATGSRYEVLFDMIAKYVHLTTPTDLYAALDAFRDCIRLTWPEDTAKPCMGLLERWMDEVIETLISDDVVELTDDKDQSPARTRNGK